MDIDGVGGDRHAAERDLLRQRGVAALTGPSVPERVEQLVLKKPEQASCHHAEEGEADKYDRRARQSPSSYGGLPIRVTHTLRI
ncbi:hypothetical protein ACFVU0_18260 [Streptomyces sp. NPDC058122]|uniref:hypothetical protein n=1 Tax=Streptomyces sp. NPDC058122 TaxID=3346349 RepID=UPI0036E7D5DE